MNGAAIVDDELRSKVFQLAAQFALDSAGKNARDDAAKAANAAEASKSRAQMVSNALVNGAMNAVQPSAPMRTAIVGGNTGITANTNGSSSGNVSSPDQEDVATKWTLTYQQRTDDDVPLAWKQPQVAVTEKAQYAVTSIDLSRAGSFYVNHCIGDAMFCVIPLKGKKFVNKLTLAEKDNPFEVALKNANETQETYTQVGDPFGGTQPSIFWAPVRTDGGSANWMYQGPHSYEDLQFLKHDDSFHYVHSDGRGVDLDLFTNFDLNLTHPLFAQMWQRPPQLGIPVLGYNVQTSAAMAVGPLTYEKWLARQFVIGHPQMPDNGDNGTNGDPNAWDHFWEFGGARYLGKFFDAGFYLKWGPPTKAAGMATTNTVFKVQWPAAPYNHGQIRALAVGFVPLSSPLIAEFIKNVPVNENETYNKEDINDYTFGPGLVQGVWESLGAVDNKGAPTSDWSGTYGLNDITLAAAGSGTWLIIPNAETLPGSDGEDRPTDPTAPGGGVIPVNPGFGAQFSGQSFAFMPKLKPVTQVLLSDGHHAFIGMFASNWGQTAAIRYQAYPLDGNWRGLAIRIDGGDSFTLMRDPSRGGGRVVGWHQCPARKPVTFSLQPDGDPRISFLGQFRIIIVAQAPDGTLSGGDVTTVNISQGHENAPYQLSVSPESWAMGNQAPGAKVTQRFTIGGWPQPIGGRQQGSVMLSLVRGQQQLLGFMQALMVSPAGGGVVLPIGEEDDIKLDGNSLDVELRFETNFPTTVDAILQFKISLPNPISGDVETYSVLIPISGQVLDGAQRTDNFVQDPNAPIPELAPDWALKTLYDFRNTRSVAFQRRQLLRALYCLMFSEDPDVRTIQNRFWEALKTAQAGYTGTSSQIANASARGLQTRLIELNHYLQLNVLSFLNIRETGPDFARTSFSTFQNALVGVGSRPGVSQNAVSNRVANFARAGSTLEAGVSGPLGHILMLVAQAIEVGNKTTETQALNQSGQANFAARPMWGFNALDAAIWAVGTIASRAQSWLVTVNNVYHDNPVTYLPIQVSLADRTDTQSVGGSQAWDFVIPRGFITSEERSDQINYYRSNGFAQDPAVQSVYSRDFIFGLSLLNTEAGVYDDLTPLFNAAGRPMPGVTYPNPDSLGGQNGIMTGAMMQPNAYQLGAGMQADPMATQQVVGNSIPGVVPARVLDPMQFASMQGRLGVSDIVRRPANYIYPNESSIDMELYKQFWDNYHRAAVAKQYAEEIKKLNALRPRRKYQRKALDMHVGASAPQRSQPVEVAPQPPQNEPKPTYIPGQHKVVAGPVPSQLRVDRLFGDNLHKWFFS